MKSRTRSSPSPGAGGPGQGGPTVRQTGSPAPGHDCRGVRPEIRVSLGYPASRVRPSSWAWTMAGSGGRPGRRPPCATRIPLNRPQAEPRAPPRPPFHVAATAGVMRKTPSSEGLPPAAVASMRLAPSEPLPPASKPHLVCRPADHDESPVGRRPPSSCKVAGRRSPRRRWPR